MLETMETPNSGDPQLQEQCGQCGQPLDRNGSPKWCKSCWARYQREYQALKGEMAEGKGFARGVAAFRTMLIENFNRLGTGTFAGDEVAALIAQASLLPPARVDAQVQIVHETVTVVPDGT